jgi:hypothetical protein
MDDSPKKIESLTNVLLIPGTKNINEDLQDYLPSQTNKIVPFKINNNSGYLQNQRTAEETYEEPNFNSRRSSESSIERNREFKARSN